MLHKNFFAVLPNAWHQLKGAELSVYLEICWCYCQSKEEYVKITYDELTDRTQLSKRSVRNACKSLEEQGIIDTKKTRMISDGSQLTPIKYKPYILGDNDDLTPFQRVADFATEKTPEKFATVFLSYESNTYAVLTNSSLSSYIHTPQSNCRGVPPQRVCGVSSVNGNHTNNSNKTDKTKGSRFPIDLGTTANNSSSKDKIVVDKDGDEVNLDICKDMAKQLYVALAKRNRITRKADLRKWTNRIFEFFIDSCEFVSLEDFRKILDWYCKSIGKEFVKDAFSANSFCDHYASMYAAWEKEMIKKNDGKIIVMGKESDRADNDVSHINKDIDPSLFMD